MSRVYLGLDTSNYKTSITAVNGQGEVLFERSELLEVKKGERGLRQSDAFFAHSGRLPVYISRLFETLDPGEITAIGVSSRPRRVEGSYMPCFLAGVHAADILSSSLKVPTYSFSHQEGHAAAVLDDEDSEVIFMHLSGGTSEFLKCIRDSGGYSMEIVGGTKDISIGQLIDRTGVALGYRFPSGPYLDELAYSGLMSCGFDSSSFAAHDLIPKIKLDNGYFNLSGAETRMLRYIESDPDPDKVSLSTALFVHISRLLTESADVLSTSYGASRVYMAGGVASSRTVRELIPHMPHKADIKFGSPERSGDNAVGTALLARRIHETGKRFTGQ